MSIKTRIEGTSGRQMSQETECEPMTEDTPKEGPVPEDNWAGRSTHMICRGCRFYVRKGPDPSPVLRKEVGRCRRHAPTMSGWPVMFWTDWCGDHQIDENRV